MSQKYTIKEVGKRFGDANDWLPVVFEEHTNEPVLLNMPANVEIKPGMTISGKIGTTKSGKPKLVKDEPFKLDMRQAMIIAQSQIAHAIQMASDHTNAKEVRDLTEMYFDIVMDIAKERGNG